MVNFYPQIPQMNADLLVMGVASRRRRFFFSREGAKEKIFYPQIPQINADL